jgi:proteasome lid subunit RPN8/RPN11
MKVSLSQALRQQIFEQTEAGYPHEAGGFLFGVVNNGEVQVEDVMQVENVFEEEERHHRILLSPLDFARLEDEAEARGLALVGYYHSHPDSPAVPSTYDRDHAWPNFVYLITSVQGKTATDMRAWWLRADRSQFDEGQVAVGD